MHVLRCSERDGAMKPEHWTTCMTRAQKEFHLADEALGLKNVEKGKEHWVKCIQWLVEAGRTIGTDP